MTEQLLAETTCSAPPQVVFALLEDGSRWSEWAGVFVPRSRWAVETTPPGTVGAVRRLGIGPLGSSERITEHVPDRRLSYEVASWQPYKDYRSTVELTETAGGTRISWASSFTPRVPGTGRLLRWGLLRLVSGFAANLARAAEAVDPGSTRSS